MAKLLRKTFNKLLLICVVFVLVIGWFFSGWPRIWSEPAIPPEIEKAKADTATYLPTSDVSANWSCTGTGCTTGHYEALNESTADLDTGNYIYAISNSSAANDEHQIGSITESGINYLRLHYYADTGNRAQINVMLQSDGTTQASNLLSPNSAAQWRYVQWDTSNVGTITAEFAISDSGTGKPGNGTVYAWYIEVDYTPGNQAPTVDSVSISPTPTVTLNAASTTTVTISATITDNDGCEEVFTSGSIVARFYRSGAGDTCTADDNNCYTNITLTEVDNTCDGAGDYTGDASGTVDVQFHADPTDEGSYATSQGWDTQNWVAKVTATDSSSDSGSNTSTVEIGTLIAFSLDQGSIGYGTLNPNEVSSQQSVLVTTTGNAPIDIQLSGTDMTWSGNTIGVGQQKYSASSGFDWETEGTALTTGSVCHELSSGKPTDSPSNATEYTYWKLKVPTGKPAGGPYSGTNTFDVVADSVCP